MLPIFARASTCEGHTEIDAYARHPPQSVNAAPPRGKKPDVSDTNAGQVLCDIIVLLAIVPAVFRPCVERESRRSYYLYEAP